MKRLDELIENEKQKHKDDSWYSYDISDLLTKDFIKNKGILKQMTVKAISDMYGISYGRTAKYLRISNIKVKREYNKADGTKKKVRVPKMTKEEHEIASWAYTFNKGKIRYVYYDMIRRCYKLEDRSYYRYGARGITVCDEWKNNHLNFFKWAKDNGYAEGLQLDRIDNNKGYSPDNCHWVTPRENSLNRQDTRWIVYAGERHTLKDWAEKLGISYQVLADRIYRYRWSIDRAFTTKVND